MTMDPMKTTIITDQTKVQQSSFLYQTRLSFAYLLIDNDNVETGGNDELIELENSYYEGDDLKNDDPTKAIEMFEKVVEMETKQGDVVKWYVQKTSTEIFIPYIPYMPTFNT